MAFYLPLSLIAFTAAAAVANAKPQQENPAQPSALEQPPQIQQQQQPPVAVAEGFSTNGADVPKCGTKETDFAPCIPKDRANNLFKYCCQQYAPEGCHSLCKYETDELAARNLLLQAVKARKCDLKHMSTVLYCASQNQDNRKCCEHLNLSDTKLGVGNRCLRFCDPGGESISSINKTDVTCLFNWNVLMYCHHAGIKLN